MDPLQKYPFVKVLVSKKSPESTHVRQAGSPGSYGGPEAFDCGVLNPINEVDKTPNRKSRVILFALCNLGSTFGISKEVFFNSKLQENVM